MALKFDSVPAQLTARSQVMPKTSRPHQMQNLPRMCTVITSCYVSHATLDAERRLQPSVRSTRLAKHRQEHGKDDKVCRHHQAKPRDIRLC